MPVSAKTSRAPSTSVALNLSSAFCDSAFNLSISSYHAGACGIGPIGITFGFGSNPFGLLPFVALAAEPLLNFFLLMLFQWDMFLVFGQCLLVMVS